LSEHDRSNPLGRQEGNLVDLVDKALVDPNLHTDTRMRLAREITDLLRDTHDDIYGSNGREVHRAMREAHGDRVPSLLEAVLVDPALHTDTRMRLHSEIREILRKADCAAADDRRTGSA
jgi:hypothetical protein